MTLLIFFSVVFATIVFAIVLERIIHCSILVGFTFFAAFLIVAAVFDSVTLVIAAIVLGILAFIVAFLDCIFRRSRFFRNNRCLSCDCDEIVARINGNNITCNSNHNNNGCGFGSNNSGVSLVSDNGNIALTEGNILTATETSSNCSCGRNNRYRRY